MPIRAHAEEDQVKDGESGRVLVREGFDELRFVLISKFFDVVKEGGIDFMNVGWGDTGLREEFVVDELVVGVFARKGDSALVREVDMPELPEGVYQQNLCDTTRFMVVPNERSVIGRYSVYAVQQSFTYHFCQ